MNPFDLTGHTTVITGGGSGIGLGFAHGLAGAGASVSIWGRSAARLESAAEELRVHGNLVLTQVCDVSDERAVCRAMAATVTEFGRLDSCFANAGTGGSITPLIDTSLEEFRSVNAVNLDGAFLTLREAARQMIGFGNGGSLVATSSMGSRFGIPRQQAYAASKAGVIAMVNSIAVELARHGIRANSVLPGWVDTEMAADLVADPGFEAKVMSRVPQRRWGTPEDFGGIAVYLASAASAHQTASTVTLDGGYTVF